MTCEFESKGDQIIRLHYRSGKAFMHNGEMRASSAVPHSTVIGFLAGLVRRVGHDNAIQIRNLWQMCSFCQQTAAK